MKLITWNCNMAFRNKAAALLALRPDVLVLPECECPDNLRFDAALPKPSGLLWFGQNRHKGLAVLSYNDWTLERLPGHDGRFRHFVPLRVRKAAYSLRLFAVWANNPQDPDGPYVTQVWKALHHYGRRVGRSNTVLAGDFNSNTIWDRPRRVGNHSDVVGHLARKGIDSLYHEYFGQEQGREAHPTHYLYRHADKPYHLDYCFASADLRARLRSVEVGAHGDWARWSDHMPLIVEFDETASKG